MNKDFYESLDNLRMEFNPGDKVSGEIVAIDKNSVFLDINSKSEGIISKEELLDKNGELTVKNGDKLEAYFVSDKEGEIILTRKMTGKLVAHYLDEAYQNGIPVEGKVTEERKGGYTVKISGREAFCPYSQLPVEQEKNEIIGNSYTFLITEMTRFNLVLSRRKLIEREKAKRISELRKTLDVGDSITGTVSKIKDFGVFLDLDYVDGFIPVSELSWGRIENSTDIVETGDQLTTKVIDLDWEKQKITLSYKETFSWDDIEERYFPGKTLDSKITSVTDYGAFAELEKGITGLIHISKLEPRKKIHHAKDAVSPGDKINVAVESVDKENKRISLSRNFSLESDDNEKDLSEPTEGEVYSGIVTGIKDFGIFIRLTPIKTGLLHISEINKTEGNIKSLSKTYPLGSEVKVEVKNISNGKISLVPASDKDSSDDSSSKQRGKDENRGESLSDALNNLGL